jgi:peptide subunit release factor 1 (eRF1)
VIGGGTPKACPLCNAPLTIEVKDLVEDLIAIAKDAGTHVEMISGETEEGESLLALGGIGTILRFK